MSEYYGNGGTIHGTTQWETGPIERGQWSKGKSCIDCGKPISDRATRCMQCRRQSEETHKRNRKQWAAMGIQARTDMQVARLIELAEQRREATCDKS